MQNSVCCLFVQILFIINIICIYGVEGDIVPELGTEGAVHQLPPGDGVVIHQDIPDIGVIDRIVGLGLILEPFQMRIGLCPFLAVLRAGDGVRLTVKGQVADEQQG